MPIIRGLVHAIAPQSLGTPSSVFWLVCVVDQPGRELGHRDVPDLKHGGVSITHAMHQRRLTSLPSPSARQSELHADDTSCTTREGAKAQWWSDPAHDYPRTRAYRAEVILCLACSAYGYTASSLASSLYSSLYSSWPVSLFTPPLPHSVERRHALVIVRGIPASTRVAV